MLDVKFPFKALICRQTLSQLRFVSVNFTPSVPIQFVIPHVEDRESMNYSGIVYKEKSFFGNIDLNLKSCPESGFVRGPPSSCRIVFLRDIC